MSIKTPWNSSEKATKRVKNPLPTPTRCNCCTDWNTGEPSTEIEILSHDEVYGRSYSKWPWLYVCLKCEARVGMHPFTNIPLGTLADAPLRKARSECKKPFESLWNSGRMSRDDAYKRLSEKLGINTSDCHFGWFDIDMCKMAAAASREIFFNEIEK